MSFFRRYQKWWWSVCFFAIIGALIYRFEWAIRSVGIPLEWSWGAKRISLQHVIISLLMMMGSILISLWLSLKLEARILGLQSFDSNFRVILTKVLRAILIIVSVFICGSALGIDLTLFSVMGGALGVGLGLALQRIASNYIAGYIILLERSLLIGRMVRVDKYYGRLTLLTNRYAVLDGLDGTEVLLPNELLITQPVISYAHTEPATAVSITILMRHDINLEAVLEVVLSVGVANPRVLKTVHPPSAWVSRINELGIELELSVWIADPEEGVKGLKSELYRAVWAEFVQREWEFARLPSLYYK